MPVSTDGSSLYTLKSFLIVQASPFSDSVSNFLNCLLSFRDYSYIFWVVVGLALTGAFIGVLVLRDRYLQKHPERMRKRRRRRHAAKETGRESDGGQGREP